MDDSRLHEITRMNSLTAKAALLTILGEEFHGSNRPVFAEPREPLAPGCLTALAPGHLFD